ncbi:hypothetical protein [Hymenobacter jeongseonensis]|uniref:hypothetical protein n=1 Tax=Hymenobacter jeongseonensis TaxID=2791027 RepID=UPI0018AF6D82|nr:hypothetical protein [Hymenobacter jeongseonensis]
MLRGYSRRTLTAEEVTKTCEVLLAAALHRRCNYWLLDGRVSHHQQPVELHEWLEHDYYPRVRAQLGQSPCIAFLVDPRQWPSLQQFGHSAPLEWPALEARVGWFQEEAAALAWLRAQGAHARERKKMQAATARPDRSRGEQLIFNF